MDGAFDMKGSSPMGSVKPSKMPAPNMQQAGAMPKAPPGPMPSSGFPSQQQGGMPALPKLMGE